MTKWKRTLQLEDNPVKPIVAVCPIPKTDTAFAETVRSLEQLITELKHDTPTPRDITIALGRVRGHLNFIRAQHKLNSALSADISNETELALAKKYDPDSVTARQERNIAQASEQRARQGLPR